ncbi:hypothetical protein EPD60_00815 [Flaviaesturariibacter flavus]|uniref:Uncharacterized protein n=1 Tax=Flaviaesturariibacter flavus TaxID=2502780 RepID=A0A4R1BNQ7_9BACT|nr:hypothetical protein [Flaviaesturariibacter flavus]TCJ18987.1 hypothetical protein EPD60_00815 [Flaviaesturariibacter flavus]
MSTDQHKRGEQNTANNDAIVNRHPRKNNNNTADAQNVADDNVGYLNEPLNEGHSGHARNKAQEGLRQNSNPRPNNDNTGRSNK